MSQRLPSPPTSYDQRWASDLVRGLDFALNQLSQPIALGYRSQVAYPDRTIDAGAGTSARGEVGTVRVSIAGGAGVQVAVTGVGGSGTAPSVSEIAQVLATLISDAKARGILG